MTTYRQYQRMPAHVAARRFNATTQQLREECNKPAPAANDDFTADKNAGGRMLILAFGLGAMFWMILGWAFI